VRLIVDSSFYSLSSNGGGAGNAPCWRKSHAAA
jgi:hypothetical protein